MRRIKMTDSLKKILDTIAKEYKDHITNDSRYYTDGKLANKAQELGLSDVKESFSNEFAIVPIKRPIKGMKVRIDGRTFANYAQFDSGVIVPMWVAQKAGITYKQFTARDSMVYNFS